MILKLNDFNEWISHNVYYVNFRISNEKMKKYVKLSPEFMCYPIWMEEDNLIIQIKDSAKGIDEKIIDKIFEPYFTTKHKFKGTGIGLYMSKLLVEKHLKGSIKASNTEFTFMDKIHKGALFEIILPIS